MAFRVLTIVFLLGTALTARSQMVVAPQELPPPTGRIVRVSSVTDLQNAVGALASGTTILIAPGTYRLTRTLYVRGVDTVSLRGDSADRDAVVLVGPGMANADYGNVPFGIWAGDGVTNLLIANLTVREFYFHPIILNAGVTRAHVYNVHLIDAGQQFLKSNPGPSGKGNDFGIVERSMFEFTTTGRDDYPKAIDLHGAVGWIIRQNVFRNIRAPGDLLNGPAVLVWRESRDTLVEGNTFINCQREIVFGAETVTPNSHQGGVVRNNVIYRDGTFRGDAAISVWDSPGTQVLGNTVLLSGTYPTAIEARFPDTSGVVIASNVTDASILLRDDAAASIVDNRAATAVDRRRIEESLPSPASGAVGSRP